MTWLRQIGHVVMADEHCMHTATWPQGWKKAPLGRSMHTTHTSLAASPDDAAGAADAENDAVVGAAAELVGALES